jgi:hypothetical protein
MVCLLADQLHKSPAEILEWDMWEIGAMVEYYAEKYKK